MKNDILLKWQQPQIVDQHAGSLLLKGAWKKVLRVTGLTVVLTVAAYWGLKKLNIDDDKFCRVLLLLPLFALGYTMFVCVIVPYMAKFSKTTIFLKEKGLSKDSSMSNAKLILWKNIIDYSVEDDPEFPELKVLQYITKEFSVKRRLYFDDEAVLNEALGIFDARVTKSEVPEEVQLNLSKVEIGYIVVWCVACGVAAVVYFRAIMEFLGEWVKILVPLTFILGPGTLALIQLRRFKVLKSRKGFRLALTLNLLWFVLLMITGIIIVFWKVYKEVNG
ncbi:MAG: hypothetical protein JW936_08400 [Sedimentisphaerales bacterium]|nr:hypothetical protein [Sedimentisphaerales bacterium]